MLTSLLILGGCRSKEASTTDASASAAVVGPLLIVPPPSNELTPGGAMRYFEWAPPAPLSRSAHEPDAKLALRVLSSAEITRRLGVRPGLDVFTFEQTGTKEGDATKKQLTFRQGYVWRGQTVPVFDSYATVEIVGDALSYLGTGFVSGVSLTDQPTSFDEEKAGLVAVKDWEARQPPAKGVVKKHDKQGLAIRRAFGNVVVAWKGDTLAHLIEVAGEGGHGDAEMILVDAFSGQVLRRYPSAIE